MASMIACVDVSYDDRFATAACLLFSDWAAAAATERVVLQTPPAAPYRPGEFYLRELPPLLAVLSRVPAEAKPLQAVLVDGYVWLGGEHPGLGAHLYGALEEKVPIIGVAKTAWGATAATAHPQRRAIATLRGHSAKPLWVTAAGMAVTEAAAHVTAMHGAHRTPTLLRAVDRLTRERAAHD